MERVLKKGTVLTLGPAKTEYTIEGLQGTGASCVVYLASVTAAGQEDVKTEHLLKEYQPRGVSLMRMPDGTLTPNSPQDAAAFAEGLQRFLAGAKKQVQFRSFTDETGRINVKNTTSNVQAILEGNGTAYIDMSLFDGATMDRRRFDSLYDLLRCLRAVTKVVGQYHAMGYLHLDLKPENILILAETPEMVMLFDFDSVTEKKDVRLGKGLSYTKSWAAPEQLPTGRTSEIREATDLFAIGEILFFFLFGRHSMPEERRSFSRYRFETAGPLMRGADPALCRAIDAVLQATVKTSVSKRVQSADKLTALLDDAILRVDPSVKKLIDKRFQMHSLSFQESEFADLRRRLDKEHTVFLSGEGSVRFAMEYETLYANDYGKIVHTVAEKSLLELLLVDGRLPITNLGREPGETDGAFAARKFEALRFALTKNDLLVIAGKPDPDDPLASDFSELPCSVLFVSDAPHARAGLGLDLFRKNRFANLAVEMLTRVFGANGYSLDSCYIKKVNDSMLPAFLPKIRACAPRIPPENVLFFCVTKKNLHFLCTPYIVLCYQNANNYIQLRFDEVADIIMKGVTRYAVLKENGSLMKLMMSPQDWQFATLRNLLILYHTVYDNQAAKSRRPVTPAERFRERVILSFMYYFRESPYELNGLHTRETGFPPAMYTSLAKRAPGCRPEDVILYVNITPYFEKLGDASSVIITLNGYYNPFKHLPFAEARDLCTSLSSYYYIDPRGEKKTFTCSDPKFWLPFLQDVVNAYHEIFERAPRRQSEFTEKERNRLFTVYFTEETPELTPAPDPEPAPAVSTPQTPEEKYKSDFIAVLQKYYPKKIQLYKPFWYGDPIPQTLRTACASFGCGAAPEDVIAFFDTTKRKNGKEGYLFTKDGYAGKSVFRFNQSFRNVRRFYIYNKEYRYEKNDGTSSHWEPPFVNELVAIDACNELLRLYQEYTQNAEQ